MEVPSMSDHVVLIMNEDVPNTNNNNNKSLARTKTTTTTTRQSERTKTLRRLSFSKPKARLVEYNNNNHVYSHSSASSSSSSSDDDDEDESETKELELEECDEEGHQKYKRKRRKKKVKWRLLIEWVMFLIIMTCLVSSLTIKSLKVKRTWGLEIWKWCLMVLVTFCGRLVSGWVMGFVVYLIERNFMLREKVLYFVYGLRKSIQNCAWLGLVLLAWTFMFNDKLHKDNKFLNKVFQALIAIMVDATIWLVKIVLVKMLASSFHVSAYFDRMKESVFHHYILETLSGPPILSEDDLDPINQTKNSQLGFKSLPENWRKARIEKTTKFGSLRKIDMERLRKLSLTKKKSVWSLKKLISYVMSSGLSTISKTVDEFSKAGSEITSEWDARTTAKRIFKNVATPGAKFIEEEDLMRFLTRIEIHTIFPLFEGALETGKISKSAFRNWVVRAYFERKSLAHSLNDTKTAVQQLHKLASAVVAVIIVVVTLLLMGLATLKIVFFVTTQVVIIGVIFQNMCKTVFESIVFVFIMHPFDIGDRCVVDGVQMIVEEMNILTTVFLRYDMEKIYYPNSVLLTKPIGNFYRSPEMGDAIDFSIDFLTSMETIVALKKAIQTYIESKPNYWNPKHSVIVKEIQNVQSLKMSLCVQHTINHQNYGERNLRITELILELKKIFESLGIRYRLLSQEIHLTQFNNAGHV